MVSYSLWPHGLGPAGLLCPWNLPGKNTGVFLPLPSPGDLPDLGIEPESLVSPALAGRFIITSTTWEASDLRMVELSRDSTLFLQ